jgi:acetyl-CoA dehydrogenase-like protein
MTATLFGYLMGASEKPTEIDKVGLTSVRFLLAVGDLLIGWRLLVQPAAAHAALSASPSVSDKDFYRGKIATTTMSCSCPRSVLDRSAGVSKPRA